MKDKFFSPKEAELMLPLIRSIVRDILKTGQDLKNLNVDIQKEYEEILEKREYLKHLLEEIESLGCIYKDWNFEVGLIDFPALIDEDIVLLCWRSDEDHVLHYHNHVEGFAGRKPIPSNLLTHLSPSTIS
ncbi:MAG: hypothetical protein COA79_03060 [Planctomycetota bacterium]|nr:MAG: hypothetical protein COA79_03060 [Planctomycetota bacterium]